MSNFTGVTFAQQKVLPSDDALIRRRILTDGILSGCELSYSGSTLTMSAGQLLACGRQFRHPSAQNWAVVDATTGFARLLLTVDLTRTASKDVFDQIVDSIEYATSEDGFPDLQQSDINASGSIYQIEACVVSLGTGGITGIVKSFGSCVAIGGGTSLNFRLVGGLTQPTDPEANTIWVKSDAEILGYWFGSTEPTDADEGTVWIQTGTSSGVEFNVLKENGVEVYPLSAKQYISGDWKQADAYIYQEDKWVQFSEIITELYLYTAGNTQDSVTGGWKTLGAAQIQSDYLAMMFKSDWKGAQLYTNNAIDMSGFKYLNVEVKDWSRTCYVGINDTKPKEVHWNGSGFSNKTDCERLKTIDGNGTTQLPIDGEDGAFYVWLGEEGQNVSEVSGCHITAVWLS